MFSQLQSEMQPIADKIAKERHLPSSDYRDVIRELKKDQIPGDQLMPHYQQRLAEIEGIIRREHLITLPDRPAIIRLASAAETAQQPAPHMQPPPLIEQSRRARSVRAAARNHRQGRRDAEVRRFQFRGRILDAHRARSAARATSCNSTPWWSAAYRWRALCLPSTAPTSKAGDSIRNGSCFPICRTTRKLVSLDYRMLRAARAFLDPELQQGKITPEQAMQVLEKDVVCSPAFATEEVERFTFRMPGQAPSYFDGYTRLLEIRQSAEQALGPKFNVQRFHDFILSQGLLPPNLLRKAVMEDFVKQTTASN